LLRDKNLTLQSATDICRASEQAAIQARSIQKKEETVNRVSAKSKFKHKKEEKSEDKRSKTIRKCKFCGGSHEYKKQKCPAYGQTCDKCKGENHFAACCPASGAKPKKKRNSKKVHSLQDDSTFEDDSDGEVVYSVSGTSASRKYVAEVEFSSNGKPNS
jgi:hypothetical protein